MTQRWKPKQNTRYTESYIYIKIRKRCIIKQLLCFKHTITERFKAITQTIKYYWCLRSFIICFQTASRLEKKTSYRPATININTQELLTDNVILSTYSVLHMHGTGLLIRVDKVVSYPRSFSLNATRLYNNIIHAA